MPDQDVATALLVALAETRGRPADEWTDGPLFDVALRLDRVTQLHALLTEVKGWLEIEVMERMEDDDVVVNGVGVLHRTSVRRSGWINSAAGENMRDDIATTVAEAVSLDVATGELDPMKRNVALAAIRAAFEVIPAFSSMKSAGAKRFGLTIDDYRTFSDVYSVKLEVGAGE